MFLVSHKEYMKLLEEIWLMTNRAGWDMSPDKKELFIDKKDNSDTRKRP